MRNNRSMSMIGERNAEASMKVSIVRREVLHLEL